MFSYVKLFISFIVLMTIVGCGSKITEVKGYEKTFDLEDLYILYGLRAEEVKEFKSSSDIFNTLYEKSTKKEYLYRSIQNDIAANNSSKAITRIDKIIDDKIDNFTLVRLKVVALMRTNQTDKAKELAVTLVEKSKEINDYLLVSEIFVKDKQFDTAVKYLESAYVKDYNEKILDKMAIILYVNLQRKKDAIAQLESHSRIRGCSQLICSRLIGFYSNENNIEGLLSTYLRVYEINPKGGIAQKIVQIYAYKKDYKNMMLFLEKSKTDDDVLLQLYVQQKLYKKASILAEKLYENGADVVYLGQSAIFEYESTKDKNDKKMQDNVVEKLTTVVSNLNNPLYLNYLGYLLIDHEIDIKLGIKYVNDALKIDPNSSFYLDSLAWGYYKLNNCKKAKKIMDKVATMKGSDNPEVIKHIKIINKCQKVQKSKKKKVKKKK